MTLSAEAVIALVALAISIPTVILALHHVFFVVCRRNSRNDFTKWGHHDVREQPEHRSNVSDKHVEKTSIEPYYASSFPAQCPQAPPVYRPSDSNRYKQPELNIIVNVC